jgi:dihydrofolate reductase
VPAERPGEDLGNAEPQHPEVVGRILAWITRAGVHAMGRVTYQEMATFWPTSTHPFAAVMNERPEVVFSKALTRADWATSRIARGEQAEEVARLRGQPGDDVIVYGGYSLAQALSQQDLVDEYRLVTRPVALGSGSPCSRTCQRAPAPAG